MQTSRFAPIIRGKHGKNPTVTGYIELFPAFGDKGTREWVSIPGVSRFLGAGDGWLLDDEGQISGMESF